MFKKAKYVSKKNPSVVITDGLYSYNVDFTANPDIAHISGVGIQGKINNNRVERLHGSMREREKVMRHFKKAQSAKTIFEGYRIWYNFIRPHMGLKNKTPAEASNVDLDLNGNKWMRLIKEASDQKD